MSTLSIQNVVVTADVEEFGQIPLTQFLEDNEFDPEYAEEVTQELLTTGEYFFGGGAAPLIKVWVVSK